MTSIVLYVSVFKSSSGENIILSGQTAKAGGSLTLVHAAAGLIFHQDLVYVSVALDDNI